MTVKHFLAWGALSKHGITGLYFFAQGTTMNGLKYVQLLPEKLNIQMVVHNTSVFMHDGAPCHRSKVVSKKQGGNS